jgi:hypothetical protein
VLPVGDSGTVGAFSLFGLNDVSGVSGIFGKYRTGNVVATSSHREVEVESESSPELKSRVRVGSFIVNCYVLRNSVFRGPAIKV